MHKISMVLLMIMALGQAQGTSWASSPGRATPRGRVASCGEVAAVPPSPISSTTPLGHLSEAERAAMNAFVSDNVELFKEAYQWRLDKPLSISVFDIRVIDCDDIPDNSVLHLAARCNSSNILCWLMRFAAEKRLDGKTLIEQKNGDGETPLLVAARHGAHIVLGMLIDVYGANNNTVNCSGFSALNLAIEHNQETTVAYLLERYAKEATTTYDLMVIDRTIRACAHYKRHAEKLSHDAVVAAIDLASTNLAASKRRIAAELKAAAQRHQMRAVHSES